MAPTSGDMNMAKELARQFKSGNSGGSNTGRSGDGGGRSRGGRGSGLRGGISRTTSTRSRLTPSQSGTFSRQGGNHFTAGSLRGHHTSHLAGQHDDMNGLRTSARDSPPPPRGEVFFYQDEPQVQVTRPVEQAQWETEPSVRNNENKYNGGTTASSMATSMNKSNGKPPTTANTTTASASGAAFGSQGVVMSGTGDTGSRHTYMGTSADASREAAGRVSSNAPTSVTSRSQSADVVITNTDPGRELRERHIKQCGQITDGGQGVIWYWHDNETPIAADGGQSSSNKEPSRGGIEPRGQRSTLRSRDGTECTCNVDKYRCQLHQNGHVPYFC